MSYYYTLEDLGKGIYRFEQFDRRNCSSVEWVIHESCFMDISNPTPDEIAMHDMLSLSNNGLSVPPQDIWNDFLRLLMLHNLS
ncbi:hypothetical protein RW71_04417 [Escherichia coli]|nr:hypothetical protein RW71_04417 [Escherichia coli]OXZ81335.1 hypothetical protein RW72_04483 [Escherichia coli]